MAGMEYAFKSNWARRPVESMKGLRIRLVCVLMVAIVMAGCSRLYFHPAEEHFWDPARAGIVYEDVWFNTDDDLRLHAWLLPAQTDEAYGTVVFAHGNAENVSTHILNVHWLVEHGFNVFAFDYRGFGRSEGRATFAGVHRDMEAALKAAAAQPQVNPNRIVVFGQSLGGAVAVTTTAKVGHEFEVRGVAVDSPFSSWRGIGREKFGEFFLTWPFQIPLSWTISDKFAPIEYVAELSPIPLLIMVGEQDRIIPPHHGERLYEAAVEPKDIWRFEEAAHGNALVAPTVRQRLVARFREWLDNHD